MEILIKGKCIQTENNWIPTADCEILKAVPLGHVFVSLGLIIRSQYSNLGLKFLAWRSPVPNGASGTPVPAAPGLSHLIIFQQFLARRGHCFVSFECSSMLETFSYFLSLKKKEKERKEKKMGRGRSRGKKIRKGLCSDDQDPSAVGWHLLTTCHFPH